MADQVELVEVAPRDGLQSEETTLDTATKIALIERCIDAGSRRIEVASFVNPQRVPQMADAEAVLDALPDRDDVTYVGLVLNERGFERAAATKLREVNVVAVCSDTFGERNQGATIDESVDAAGAIATLARDEGVRCSVVLSVAFGCPYEGEVAPAQVADVAKRLVDGGLRELALADTIGVASPVDVVERLEAVRSVVGDDVVLRCHFHNTRGTAAANVYAALGAGVRSFDASLGGIGGCPFAPDATGNVATEDVAYLLERMGRDTGLDLDALARNVAWLEGVLGRRVPGLYAKAGPFPRRS
jgi:hydroxymethylglutaryl-CoA lyase